MACGRGARILAGKPEDRAILCRAGALGYGGEIRLNRQGREDRQHAQRWAVARVGRDSFSIRRPRSTGRSVSCLSGVLTDDPLANELRAFGHVFERRLTIPIPYGAITIDAGYRDLLIDRLLIAEDTTIERLRRFTLSPGLPSPHHSAARMPHHVLPTAPGRWPPSLFRQPQALASVSLAFPRFLPRSPNGVDARGGRWYQATVTTAISPDLQHRPSPPGCLTPLCPKRSFSCTSHAS